MSLFPEMAAPARLLHLEDNSYDAELIALHLKSEKFPCTIECVESEKKFAAALERGGFDLIMADNTGPTFNGFAALKMAKGKHPQVPFIFVSGSGDARDAARAVQSGASGYVLKDQLTELIPVIRKALSL